MTVKQTAALIVSAICAIGIAQTGFAAERITQTVNLHQSLRNSTMMCFSEKSGTAPDLMLMTAA